MGWTVLLNDAGEHVGSVGDEPWDIIGTAMDEVLKVYLDTLGRPPNDAELEHIINFTLPDKLRNMEVTVNLKIS